MNLDFYAIIKSYSSYVLFEKNKLIKFIVPLRAEDLCMGCDEFLTV